jgi:hypothetical protein
MTMPLDKWSEDDKRAAVARAWSDPPLADIDDMTAWLEAAYVAEPWPRLPLD